MCARDPDGYAASLCLQRSLPCTSSGMHSFTQVSKYSQRDICAVLVCRATFSTRCEQPYPRSALEHKRHAFDVEVCVVVWWWRWCVCVGGWWWWGWWWWCRWR